MISSVVAGVLAVFAAGNVPGVECAPVKDPKRLPALDLLIDSARLAAQLPEPDSSGPSELVYSILLGSKPTGHMVGTTDQSPRAQAVLQQILSSLRPPPRGAPETIRLTIGLNRPVTIAMARSIRCDPELLPEQTPSAVGRVQIERPVDGLNRMPPQPRDVTPRLLIGVSGDVLEVNLGAGTGLVEIDQMIRENLSAQRYRPALLDGRPIEVWLNGTQVRFRM